MTEGARFNDDIIEIQIEVDPTELEPGDIVISMVDRDERPESCHCDVRVTVLRKVNT